MPNNNNGSDIKYITVELIKSDIKEANISSIEAGLFLGVREELINDKLVTFIMTQTEKDTVKSMSLDYYNILSLEKFDGTTRLMSFFKANEDDQGKAVNLSRECLKEMDLANKTTPSDPDLIDVNTYTDVPAGFGTGNTKPVSGSKPIKIYPHGVNTQNRQQTTYVRKKPEPCLFKRKGRKPALKTLEEMRKKVKAITSGDYEVKLPVTEGDSETNSRWDEEEYKAGYLCC